MKIQINFDSWEELCGFLATANAQPGVPENTRELAQLVENAKGDAPQKSAVEKADEKLEKLRSEVEAEFTEKVPFDEDPQEAPKSTKETPKEESKEVPAYKLADAQKAVREAVKKIGKEAAKAILAKYNGATSASTLQPSDYAAVIPELEAATNA